MSSFTRFLFAFFQSNFDERIELIRIDFNICPTLCIFEQVFFSIMGIQFDFNRRDYMPDELILFFHVPRPPLSLPNILKLFQLEIKHLECAKNGVICRHKSVFYAL